MSDDPSLIGDNSRAVTRALLDEAKQATAPFTPRRDEFQAAMAKFVEIRDRVDVGKAGDLIALAKRVFEMIEAKRKEIVGPHNDAVDSVNAFFREFWDPVADQLESLRSKLDAFAEAERKRIQDQQDEQRRFEAQRRGPSSPASPATAVAPAAPRRRNVRGDYGSNTTFGEVDVIEIEDWRKLPDLIMQSEDVRNAIIKVARPLVKQKVAIEGLKVTKAAATQVRR